MGAESNLKEEGGPFIRVVSKRGKAGRAARAEIGEARGSAIQSCISELERYDDGHLVVTREGMLSTLEASYEKQLKKGGLKDSNKRRSVREPCEKSWRNCWKRRDGGLWTFEVDSGQVVRLEVDAGVAIGLRTWSRRWLGGRQ